MIYAQILVRSDSQSYSESVTPSTVWSISMNERKNVEAHGEFCCLFIT
jgi:hypothetical protein